MSYFATLDKWWDEKGQTWKSDNLCPFCSQENNRTLGSTLRLLEGFENCIKNFRVNDNGNIMFTYSRSDCDFVSDVSGVIPDYIIEKLNAKKI